ncbi:Putative SWIB/MDM2 domain protein [[Torrubiella] hemipterigena]|uniref:Putative SWIB/MDM2 domain protein n=1 Tax=[Torrubiella] hemipterigena TaxID=1531966 RepID=A0A0A1T9K9_9HYPO|nr:Putative SWIB/MDM2 domain protein [[Torrubiella] hemipterigena]
MSAPLSPEERQRYTDIIDAILATANLETISRKKIRQGLETSLGGKDLSEQKEAIKKLIEARFDAMSGGDNESNDADDYHKPATTNGKHRHSDVSASPEPYSKQVKRASSSEDADARLAAQLQAQENSLARARTRGGDRPKSTKKKAPKKKSAKRVREDDDSDVDGSESGVKKRKAGGGFQKPFNLSSPLSELVGETQLSRPQVVKKLWEHIKANDLQDPSDKRQIRCDEKMMAVFKQAKVDMFKMNKDIGAHLYPVGEEE